MDPLTINRIALIRQQEILEMASNDRPGKPMRRLQSWPAAAVELLLKAVRGVFRARAAAPAPAVETESQALPHWESEAVWQCECEPVHETGRSPSAAQTVRASASGRHLCCPEPAHKST